MAFAHGKDAKVYVAEFDLTSMFDGVSSSQACDLSEVTTFGDSAREYVTQLRDAEISLDGFFSGAANESHAELLATVGTATVVSVFPQGVGAAGDPAFGASLFGVDYEISTGVSGAGRVSLSGQSNSGIGAGILIGKMLAVSAAGNGSTVDELGAAGTTTNGGSATFHLTEFTGTSITLKVQHSANGSSWTDLISSGALTAATGVGGTATGTVERYVRLLWTGTFTSATGYVGWSRNY